MFSLLMLLDCTLWEDFIGLLEPGKSYHLCDFYLQEFRNKRSLSNRMQGSRIEEIADVDTGSVNPDSYVDEEVELTNVVIGAILKLEHYRACMRCKSRVEPIGSNQGRCTTDNCLTLQRYDLCSEHISAKLLLKPNDALPGDNSRDVHVVMSNF